MAELRLNFKDTHCEPRRAAVEKSPFLVGRHSECDLAISDSRLSRKHAKIDRIGDFFVISDLGSSNGTFLNGKKLTEPATLADGDRLSLGGFEISVELMGRNDSISASPAGELASAKITDTKKSQSATNRSRIPVWLLLAGPIAAAFLVLLVGLVVFIAVSRNSTAADDTNQDRTNDLSRAEHDRELRNVPEDRATLDSQTASKNQNRQATATPETIIPTATPDSEEAKVEANAAKFLRRIAQNDPKAFLTAEQAKIVAAKTRQFAGSSALAENIKSAQKSAAQLRSLAAAKNVKPLFLAVAAMTKLGNSRGDVFATAKSIADTLDKLTIQLGNELADDCLLTIAAYDQGAAGETMKLRNQLQDLATKLPQSSREIRTIWFLKKQGTITNAEFEMAVNFIAIGTITQNPSAFAVKAEALDL